jgi:hypothetical protein
MGMTLYITDPAVAAAYHAHPAEFVWVAEDAEALWLLSRHHAYTLAHNGALPPAYYVHPDAPAWVPPPDLTPPGTQPAKITVTAKWIAPGVFDVIFGGSVDAVAATGSFLIVDETSATLASGTWAQPANTTPDAAAGLFQTALGAFGAVIATQKFGPRLELRGTGGKVIRAVSVKVNVPKAAADPAPTPPPAPAPQGTTLGIGPEDTHTKIDVDGDGRADVHVVVDRPPQNP